MCGLMQSVNVNRILAHFSPCGDLQQTTERPYDNTTRDDFDERRVALPAR